MRGQLEAWLRARWSAFGVGPLLPGDLLQVILVPSGGGEGWRHVGMVMRGGDVDPCVVVKYPRDPSDNERIAAEHSALHMLATWSPPTAGWFPRPLATGIVADRAVAVESVAGGESLLRRMSAGGHRAEAAAARAVGLVDVLTVLALRSARECTREELRDWVVNPLRDPPAELISSAADRSVVAVLRQRADRLIRDAPLPAVFTHNDVAPPNVLVDHAGGFRSLVDWERAGWGLPLTDVLYLLARLGADDEGVRLALRRVCRECAIDPDWLPVLALLTWLGHAANELRRDAYGTREKESRRWLRRCLDTLAAAEPIA